MTVPGADQRAGREPFRGTGDASATASRTAATMLRSSVRSRSVSGRVVIATTSSACGYRAGQARSVHLDQKLTTFRAKCKTSAIADLPITVGVNSGAHVLDDKIPSGNVAISGEAHKGRIPPVNHDLGRNLTDVSYSGFARLAAAAIVALAVAGCSSSPLSGPPPTTTPASPVAAPPVTKAPAGLVRPLPGGPQAALFDATTSALVVLDARNDGPTITFFTATEARPLTLPGPANAMSAGKGGEVLVSTQGGYLRVDIDAGRVTPVAVGGHESTDFTAIARRADGRLVLGSADGDVYTLKSDNSVDAQVSGFIRVDAIVTQGDTAVVLDRAQSSVTTLDTSGARVRQALRAGEGATTMTTDPAGRLLVADTRDDELLVFGIDPLIMRQRYPVPNGPYGLAGSHDLVLGFPNWYQYGCWLRSGQRITRGEGALSNRAAT